MVQLQQQVFYNWWWTAGIMEYSTRFKNSLMGNRTAKKEENFKND